MTEEPTTGAMPQALVERLAAERARAQAAAQAAAADVEPPEPEPTPGEGADEPREALTLAQHSRTVAQFGAWVGSLVGRRMRTDAEAAVAMATFPAARRWGHVLADPPPAVCLGLLALGLAGLALEFGLIGRRATAPAAQPTPAGQGGASS